ncbi:MAG: putative metal-dependent hydrolase [Thermoflavifilum sp.]|nr:putative metal-dependent hydrolase [Thermoflavifilum sp.]
MHHAELEAMRYPIGRFQAPNPITDEDIHRSINAIATLPQELEKSVIHLQTAQLQTPYRPGGWTVQQVIHHLSDSHMQVYARFKLALTEDNPVVKPFAEDRWAALPDSTLVPIEASLALLHALHSRWVALMEAMLPEQWERTYFHPEHQQSFSLKWVACMYAWHGRHHLMHIVKLRERMGW